MAKFKLLNVVNTIILTENRIDDATRLANEIGRQEDLAGSIEFSEKINPNHKYLNFILKNYKTISEDLDDAYEIFNYFERNNKKFDNRDINKYADFNELVKTVLTLSNKRRREIEAIPGSRVLFDGEAFVVMVPETKSASCILGNKTAWCTSKNEQSYYEEYRRVGELYYILSRTKSSKDPTHKIAIRFLFDSGNKEYPPKYSIAEIRDANNGLMTEQDLVMNTTQETLNVIIEDFNTKWQDWWLKLSDEIKNRKKEENERTEYERIQAAEREELYRQRERARRLERQNQTEERRENGFYDGDDEAHALFNYLVSEGDIDAGDVDEQNRIHQEIRQITEQIDDLEQQLAEFPEDEEMRMRERLDELKSTLSDLQSELDDVMGGDIYKLFLEIYEHYGLNVYTNEYDGSEYAIGTDDECERAVREFIENFIDEFKDQPGMGFRDGYIDYFVDGKRVAEDYESAIEDWVRDSPESYIDDSDKVLTEDGEMLLKIKNEALETARKRMEDVESQIDDIEYDMGDLDVNSEEYTNLGEELSELKLELQTLEDEIDELNDEIEEIENADDYYTYSEDSIMDAVESQKNEIIEDPISFLRQFGDTNISYYVNEDELIESVINEDGRGNSLAGYDGYENEIEYNGTTYFIYRIN